MSPKPIRAQWADISCNCRVKTYPDGTRKVSAFSADILRVPGWEEQQPRQRRRKEPAEGAADGDILRSQRRAKAAILDIALSNEFSYFVTLTLDKDKVDRYDVKEVTRKLNHWLDNNVRRRGLAYVLVPEEHKDGALHFHGFFNDALPVVDSGTLDTGKGKPRKPRSKAQREKLLADGAHIVYNVPAWTMGFSTAIELYGDRRSAAGYVCKYISKAAAKPCGRWYYSGGALRRPEATYWRVKYRELRDRYEDRCRPYAVEALGCWGITFDLEVEEDAEWMDTPIV